MRETYAIEERSSTSHDDEIDECKSSRGVLLGFIVGRCVWCKYFVLRWNKDGVMKATYLKAQCLHVYGLTSVWVLICFFSMDGFLQRMPHSSQT